MQVEIAQGASPLEVKPLLRVAAVTNEKSVFNFFYIGSDNECIKALSQQFRAGLISSSFEEAKRLLLSEDLSEQPIHVFILDVAYDEAALKDFQAFLKATGKAAGTTPFLYNTPHLQHLPVTAYIRHLDDVIDLRASQYDYSAKIAFLKNAKEHQASAARTRIRMKTCYYKRAFDILVSSLLLLLAMPVMLLIALVVRLESRGPIFYNAKRAGRGYRIFKFYKFRTMVVDADRKIDALAHLNQYQDSNGPKFFKIANDPRITRVGKFLRNSSLDELPQLFNVLKGDMSLVGNRPLPLYEAATLTTNEFVERFMAPAGITGLWQIKKRGKADMSTAERIGLDISYARRSNLLYDLWIMANTPKALLQKSDV